MSTDLPPLTDMKPRLVTTLLGNPGGRVMQSFVRAWTGEYYEATVDSVVTGQASNLRISRCGADGTMLDYAVLEGAGHGAAITAEYESGQVWIWLFWGSDVGHPDGVPVRWAYNGTPSGARVLLADAQPVPDPGAGDPSHVNGYFAIDQAKDRLATKFSSGTTETYTLWKLSDYKAGTGSPLFTVPTTWPTGDLSAFQGFTTSDKSLYISRGGSQPSDQAPTLYELDWVTGAITHTLDISQLAATTSAGADGGHNEAEGLCLWRDGGGNPELLFGIDTGPTSNRRGLVFRLAAPVDGTKTKTVQIDAERVIDGPASNVVAAFSYDRTVRYTTGGFTPTGYADPVKLSECSTAVLNVSDHPDLTDDSYGFVIHAKLSWDDPTDPGRRKTATYTAQLSAADPAVVPLSQKLVAAGAVAPGQIIAGAPGHSPNVTLVNDQLVIDGMPVGGSLKGAPGGSDSATASWISTGTATKAAVGTAIDTHLGALPANVIVQGAVADGSTDDTTPIQNTLNSAATFGVHRVTFPAGTYAHGALTIPSGVTLAGEEGATLTPKAAATTFLATATNAANVTLDGLTINLAGLATSYGIQVSTGTAKFTMRNCTVNDTWTAQAVIETRDGTSDITIENCVFNGCRDTIRVNKNPTRVRILRNLFTNWKGRPIYLLGSTGFAASDVTIDHNVIRDSAAMVSADTRQPVCLSGVDSDPFQRVHITNNIIIGNGHSFTDTTTPGMADLISLHQCIDFKVSGNTLIDGGDGGLTISLQCAKGAVTGNVIERSDSSGIFLGSDTSTYTRDVTVTGNTIMNCGQNRKGDRAATARAGIWSYNATGIVITGNRLGDDQGTPTMQYAVALRTGTSQVDLAGNNTRGCVYKYSLDAGVTNVRFGSPDVIRKPGTTTLTNTATLTADPHLQMPVDPNAQYLVETFVVYTATTTADWKGGYYGPTGTTMLWTTDAIAAADASSGAGALLNRQGASIGSAPSHGGAGGQSIIAKHVGTLTTSTTGGVFGLQWCQTTAEASNATVQPGSWLRLTRVS